MRVEDILVAMEQRPRKSNRSSREFVESVDWEMNKSTGIETDIQECRNFILMAVVKGVYVDYDIGTLDVIGYIANAVVYRYVHETPGDDFSNLRWKVVLNAEELRRLSDNALFVAGFMANPVKRQGIGRGLFVFAGKRGYKTMSKIATRKTRHRRFSELSDNFEDYASALHHTSNTYFSH